MYTTLMSDIITDDQFRYTIKGQVDRTACPTVVGRGLRKRI